MSSIDDVAIETDLLEKYEDSRKEVNAQIESTLSVLDGSSMRSTRGESMGEGLIMSLTALSSEEVDSLYRIYCTPEAESLYDARSEEIFNILVESSSEAEVLAFFNFQASYIEEGGHNLGFLAKSCLGMSPVIQEYMIRAAAIIDEFFVSKSTRGANSWCLHQLQVKLAESYIEGVAEDIVIDMIPGADVIGACMMAGFDLYESIKMAKEYDDCCATHFS